MKEIMVEGLLSIQAGENPRVIEEPSPTEEPPALKILKLLARDCANSSNFAVSVLDIIFNM